MKSTGKRFSTLALILAMAPAATATITYTGEVNPDPYTSGNQLQIGNTTNGSVKLFAGDNLNVSHGIFLGYQSTGDGFLELNGNANLTAVRLQNGTDGKALVKLNSGAKMTLSEGVWQAVNSGSNGALYLTDSNTNLTTSYFQNGGGGAGLIKISDGATLSVNGNFYQLPGSATYFDFSSKYLSHTNNWAITGNANQGLNYAEPNGTFTAVQFAGNSVQYNQTYNFMKIKGNSSGLGRYFSGRENNTSVGTYNGVDLFINYFGGDGNDIVLFSDSFQSTGNVNAKPYIGGFLNIGNNSFGQVKLLTNTDITIQTPDSLAATYLGIEAGGDGVLDMTANDTNLFTSSLYNGSSGKGHIKLGADAHIFTKEVYSQADNSTLSVTLSHAIASQNSWAITGTSNQGVTTVGLGGTLTTTMDAGRQLNLNESYNLIRVKGTQNTSQSPFENLQDFDKVATHDGVDLFITYFGGDGNDVTLFTLPYYTTGMENIPHYNGDMHIGLNTTSTLRLPNNLNQNVAGTTFIGHEGNANGTLYITGSNSKYTTNNLENGKAGTGIINVENSSSLKVTGSFFQAYTATGTATLNIAGLNSSANIKYFENARLGNATLNVSNGASIIVTGDLFQAYEMGSNGTTNINDQSTIAKFNYFENASNGNGTINVSSGSEFIVDTELQQSVAQNAVAIFNIEGINTKVIIKDMISAIKGSATTTVSNGASLNVTETLLQAQDAGSNALFNVSGTGTIVNIKEFDNAELGTAVTNISDNASFMVSGGLLQAIAPGSHSTINVTNNATLTVNDALIQAYETGSTAILNVSNANVLINIFQSARNGNATTTISNNAKLTIANNFVQATYENSLAVLNISGADTIVNTNIFNNAGAGNATVNISAGAKFYAIDSILQATDLLGVATLNIAGSNTQVITDYIDNGNNGEAHLNIKAGGQLVVDDIYFQNKLSDVSLDISSDYLSTNNLWAITGNIRDEIVENDGINEAYLDGDIFIDLALGHILDYNQTYNFMQIANDFGILETDFDNYAEDDIVASQGDIDVYITYQGGDGNDIVFYTTRNYAQGDANGDDIVDSIDIDLTIQHFGTTSNSGDANHDGKTDLEDLFAIRNNFGNISATTIPEPTTAALLSLGFLGLIKRR